MYSALPQARARNLLINASHDQILINVRNSIQHMLRVQRPENLTVADLRFHQLFQTFHEARFRFFGPHMSNQQTLNCLARLFLDLITSGEPIDVLHDSIEIMPNDTTIRFARFSSRINLVVNDHLEVYTSAVMRTLGNSNAQPGGGWACIRSECYKFAVLVSMWMNNPNTSGREHHFRYGLITCGQHNHEADTATRYDQNFCD